MNNPFLKYTEAFNRLGTPYMVTGSVAATIYGEPRFTQDVDLVLVLEDDAQAEALVQAFPEEEFYCAPAEVVKIERRRAQRGHFNIIDHDTGFKADVYLAHDALHAWGLANRERVDVDGNAVYLAPLEYVVVRKLMYFREGGSEKHLNDIRRMLEVSGESVRQAELGKWIEVFGLQAEWGQANEPT